MKIVMMGSGAVGGYYGARLAQAGHEVAFVARGRHAEAMRRNGLQIKSELGDALIKPLRVLDSPEDAQLIILAVKLWDTEQAACELGKTQTGTVISLQNGIEKDEVLAAAIGRDRVLGGVTHIGAVIAEPGVIVHTGKLQRITVGELDHSLSDRVRQIADAFKSAGIETVVSNDIRRVTWEKFIFLTAASGLTALTRRPLGAVREHPATRAMLLDALLEATALARAEGMTIDDAFAHGQLELIDTLPAEMLSSMAQDLLHGHRLELDWLSGAVMRRGQKHSVPTPTHRDIYAGLVPHAQGVVPGHETRR